MFFPMDACKKCLWGTKCSERVVKGTLLQYDVFLFCQSHPQGQEPHSQLCCLLVHFSRNASTYAAHRHAGTNKHRRRQRIHTGIHMYIHTHRHLQKVDCLQVKCYASPSLLPPCPPPLPSSLWLPRTRRPTVQWDTIYHCRNNYWRHFIVRKFQAILPPSPSPYLSSPVLPFRLSFLLSCHPLLLSPSLHGSHWAPLQVTLPLAQAHHCRLQHRGSGALYYISSKGPDRLFSLCF